MQAHSPLLQYPFWLQVHTPQPRGVKVTVKVRRVRTPVPKFSRCPIFRQVIYTYYDLETIFRKGRAAIDTPPLDDVLSPNSASSPNCRDTGRRKTKLLSRQVTF